MEELENKNEECDAIGYVGEELEYMITMLNELKGKNRSERMRYWAIFITELEKLYAFHQTYLRL